MYQNKKLSKQETEEEKTNKNEHKNYWPRISIVREGSTVGRYVENTVVRSCDWNDTVALFRCLRHCNLELATYSRSIFFVTFFLFLQSTQNETL